MAAAPFFLFFVFWYWAHGMTTYERWNDYDYAQRCRSRPLSCGYSRGFLSEPQGTDGASPNVSALCRELSLNRTQFNRYLAGESFRGQIFCKKYATFGLDARILLQPLSELKNDPSNAQAFYGLHEFLNMRPGNVLNICFLWILCVFTPQLYLSRHIHPRHRSCVSQGWMTYITGREPISEMRKQSLPIDKYAREFRGMVLAMDTGLGMLVSRRRFMTGSFNFVAPVPSLKTTIGRGMRCAHRGNSPPHRVPRAWCTNIWVSFRIRCLQQRANLDCAAWMNCPVITRRCCCWTVL